MLNKCIFIGRLGRDADFSNGGAPRCRFSIATEQTWNDKLGQQKKNTDWISCVCWRNVAKEAQDLRKKDVVYVEGRFTSSSWDDRKTGEKRYKSEITVDKVVILPFIMAGPVVSAVLGSMAMIGMILASLMQDRGSSSEAEFDRRSGAEFDNANGFDGGTKQTTGFDSGSEDFGSGGGENFESSEEKDSISF